MALFIVVIAAVTAIPAIIIPASEPAAEKPAVLATKVLSREKPLLTAEDPSGKPSALAAEDPSGDPPALAAEDPSGDPPALAAEDPSGEPPALLAARDPPGEPPALAARVRKRHVHGNPATPATSAPAIPRLRNGVRWIPNRKRGQCYEKCDAPQYEPPLPQRPASPLALLWSVRRPQGFHRKLVNAASDGPMELWSFGSAMPGRRAASW
jgi:hypothetical protein